MENKQSRQCTYNRVARSRNVYTFLVIHFTRRVRFYGEFMTGNNNTHLGLQVKCPIFSPDSNTIWILSTELQRSLQYQISRKSVQ